MALNQHQAIGCLAICLVGLILHQILLVAEFNRQLLPQLERPLTRVAAEKSSSLNTEKNQSRRHSPRVQPFSVDVLSISSLSRPEFAQTQRQTWGSHRTIRNFFVATEEDDPYPECSVNFTIPEVSAYAELCHNKNKAWRKDWSAKAITPTRNFITQYFTLQFARNDWLAAKDNPGGWLCGQRRMAAGLAKVGRLYRKYGLSNLPDFLILTDDDTYINMWRFESEVLLAGGDKNSTVIEDGADSNAKVYAGCLVIASPAKRIQFSFPFGGWGIYFSKGAIERLIMPLHCNKYDTNQTDGHESGLPTFEEGACRRLFSGDEDLLSEKQFWSEGMSISDLMGAMANSTSSERPYCMHSDWNVGYFVNFYNISGIRWNGPEAHIGWYPNVPQNRIHPLGQQSFIYRHGKGNCDSTGKNCNSGSFVCHYMNQTQMENVHKIHQRANANANDKWKFLIRASR